VKFRLEDILPEGRAKIYEQQPSWLDERLAGEEKKDFGFQGPIHIRLTLNRSGRVVTAKSRIEAQMNWICARCLESFSHVVISEITSIFKPRPDHPFPEEVELNREDAETDFYDGDEVDLTELIQDQVLLAFPPKVLCKAECRGLCPTCGKNRNREACDCREDSMDPRFSVLKALRLK